MKTRNDICVILGGYVNGYGLVQSIVESGADCDLAIVDAVFSCASASRYVSVRRYARDERDLASVMEDISRSYDRVVCFPTSDNFLLLLARLSTSGLLAENIILTFDPLTTVDKLSKDVQLAAVTDAGLPVPRSTVVSSLEEVRSALDLQGLLLVKPVETANQLPKPFRALRISNLADLELHAPILSAGFCSGGSYIASELIEGPDSAVYAYTAYTDSMGNVLGEWCGRKLAQFPNEFGVFASAVSVDNDVLLELGRRAVRSLGSYGIIQAEFKKSEQDGLFYFIEFSLRSDMWHRLGALSGVNIPAFAISEAGLRLGVEAGSISGVNGGSFRLVYLWHEIGNLIGRPGYAPTFFSNVFDAPGERRFALFSFRDPLPGVVSLRNAVKIFANSVARRVSIIRRITNKLR